MGKGLGSRGWGLGLEFGVHLGFRVWGFGGVGVRV